MGKRSVHMNGESLIVKAGYRFDEVCCDCGLTHMTWVSYDPQIGMVSITSIRDEEKTKKNRKKLKKQKKERFIPTPEPETIEPD